MLIWLFKDLRHFVSLGFLMCGVTMAMYAYFAFSASFLADGVIYAVYSIFLLSFGGLIFWALSKIVAVADKSADNANEQNNRKNTDLKQPPCL